MISEAGRLLGNIDLHRFGVYHIIDAGFLKKKYIFGEKLPDISTTK